MQIFGHRGNRVPGPENTVEAVGKALADGADGVETDARLASDGRVLISHDPIVATADPVTLEELLDLCLGRGRLICEIKNVPGQPDFDAPECAAAAAVVELLAGRSGDDVVVSSFDWHSLELVRSRAADVATAFLTPPGVAVGGSAAYASSAGHAEIHPHVSAVLGDLEAVARAQQLGLRVVCWTVNSLADARSLAAAGVDGIICDDPAAMIQALRSDAAT